MHTYITFHAEPLASSELNVDQSAMHATRVAPLLAPDHTQPAPTQDAMRTHIISHAVPRASSQLEVDQLTMHVGHFCVLDLISPEPIQETTDVASSA